MFTSPVIGYRVNSLRSSVARWHFSLNCLGRDEIVLWQSPFILYFGPFKSLAGWPSTFTPGPESIATLNLSIRTFQHDWPQTPTQDRGRLLHYPQQHPVHLFTDWLSIHTSQREGGMEETPVPRTQGYWPCLRPRRDRRE